MGDLKVGDRVWRIEKEIPREYIVIKEADAMGFLYVIKVNGSCLSRAQENIIADREYKNDFKKTKADCVNALVDKLKRLIDE